MNTIMRYFLPAYLALYFGLAFVWRSYLTWKRTGRNPYVLGNTDNAHDYIGRLFRLSFAVCVLVVLIYSFWPEGYQYLTPIFRLQRPGFVLTGAALLLISLVWILAAQEQMGNSWRVGIDAQTKTELVRRGVFRLSRNPIFLGMRLTLLGLFLVLPNAVTLAALVLGDSLIQIQVRLEEEFLSRIHGDEYEQYRCQTRRWL